MEREKEHLDLVDRDNYPEVIPEVLPEVYQDAPEVYKEAPEVNRDGELAEALPNNYSTALSPTKPQGKWKRYRIWILVCGLIITIAVIGGAVGGSVAATTHKATAVTKPTTTNTATTAAIQTAYSFPTAISPLPGRKAVFGATDGSNGLPRTMWSKSFQNTTWDSNFTTIGGPLSPSSWANLGVTRRTDGVLDMFAIGRDRSCVQKHWNGTNSTSVPFFAPLGTEYFVEAGDFQSSVESMSTFATRLDLFGLTEAKRLTQLVWINGIQTAWTEVIGQNTSTSWLFTPAIVVATPNRGDVFVVDAKTLQVIQLFWIDSGVNPIVSRNIGGSCTSRPSAISRSDGSIDIFCRDANALLSWSSLPSLTWYWTEWKPITGSPVIMNEPHAISYTHGSLQVFVQTVNGSIALANFNGQEWAWMDLGGTFSGPPKAMSDNARQIDVFAYGKDGALKHLYWKEGNRSDTIPFVPLGKWDDLGKP